MSRNRFYNGIACLDHPVIAARDLEAARRAFERLGFTVPPRGSHVEWGTGNLCIMFPDDYLELRGIIDPSRFTMHLDEHLERFGEGLMGIAFGTADAGASRRDAMQNGIATGDLRRLTRNFEHPEGWTQPAFELYAPSSADVDGLMHVVVIEHLTPELIRRPDFLRHANGCRGVISVAGEISETTDTSKTLRRLLGDDAVRESAGGVVLRLPSDQTIELLLEDVYAATYGVNPGARETGGPRLGAITLGVARLDATAGVLRDSGVGFTRPVPGRIRVAPDDACGATLDFIEA